MDGGNTNEYANLIRQTDEYGNPVVAGNMEDGRQGLSTSVGYATGGAGCHYDFGDTTGGVGFGAAAAYLGRSGDTAVGGDSSASKTGNEQKRPAVDTGVVHRSDVVTKETAKK